MVAERRRGKRLEGKKRGTGESTDNDDDTGVDEDKRERCLKQVGEVTFS